MLNNEVNIQKVQIMKYREQYGGGVQDSVWLSQFNAKSPDSSIKFGDTIQGISGATISSSSITRGIGKLMRLMEVVIDE